MIEIGCQLELKTDPKKNSTETTLICPSGSLASPESSGASKGKVAAAAVRKEFYRPVQDGDCRSRLGAGHGGLK